MKLDTMLFFLLLTILALFVVRYEKSMYPFNRELSKEQLSKPFPPVEIKGSYFINMDRSIERKLKFAKMFRETNGPLPLVRVPGVLVDKKDKNIKYPGNYGCAMAHSNCLELIYNNTEGWYLVCEDDGIGNFGAISQNSAIRAIVAETDKKFINLSIQKYDNKEISKGHSLSLVHGRTTSYLVHSSYAKDLCELIRKNQFNSSKHDGVDILLANTLKEPRIRKIGNGKGAFVGIIDVDKDFSSERENENNENVSSN